LLGISVIIVMVSFCEARAVAFWQQVVAHVVGLWIGVDKILAPFRETVKI
jgi:hypothetical protein